MKKIIVSISVGVLISTTSLVAANNLPDQIDLNLDENISQALKETEKELIPIRLVSEELGGFVSWNSADQQVDIRSEDKNTSVSVGNSQVKVNGETFEMSYPAEITDGRVLVSPEFFDYIWEKQVEYDHDSESVIMTMNNAEGTKGKVDFINKEKDSVIDELPEEKSEIDFQRPEQVSQYQRTEAGISREITEKDGETHTQLQVSRGEKPTGGYEITIENILKVTDNNSLIVEISTSDPDPDEAVTQAITYPTDTALITGDYQDLELTIYHD